MSSTSLICIVNQLADCIELIAQRRSFRVAIDGRTAAGKTTFADTLAATLSERGRSTIRTSIDGFHRPKAERYARGRHSAEGYYFDARNLPAVRSMLLDPLGLDGNRSYRTACFDLEHDCSIEVPATIAPPDAVLIVDGTFLQRPELADGWDATIFLRVSEDVAARRGIERDSNLLGGPGAARDLYAKRYLPAYDLYSSFAHPEASADAVVDNDNFEYPVLTLKVGGRLKRR